MNIQSLLPKRKPDLRTSTEILMGLSLIIIRLTHMKEIGLIPGLVLIFSGFYFLGRSHTKLYPQTTAKMAPEPRW
jgi:hypothetical protein